MKPIAALLISAALIAVALPSQAAFDAYIKIKGSKQGQFKGAGRSKSSNIPAIAVSHEIVSPRDPQSGLPTGQRMHKPFLIVFEPADTAELRKALSAHEQLTSVVITMISPAGNGKVKNTQTITLTNATVVALKQQGAHGAGGGGGAGKANAQERIEVSFEFEKINYALGDGSVRGIDDWES